MPNAPTSAAASGSVTRFVLLAFAISWTVWAPAVLATQGWIEAPLPLDVLTPLSIFVGAFGPLVAALALGGGRPERRALLRRALRWRTIGAAPLAAIVVLPFAVNAVARLVDRATGGDPPDFAAGSVLALLPVFVAILLLGGPIQEELGWRGYALPRLHQRFGPVGATLVLGAVWTAWHLPFWFMEGAGMEGTPLAVYALSTLGLTGVMTWLYARTSGSVLAAILMHATANWMSNVLPTHGAEVADSNAYLFHAIGYVLAAAVLLRSTPRRPVDAAPTAPPAAMAPRPAERG